MLSPLAFEIPAFLLGLLFGSFMNVCISRLPDHKSISKPRSHCPNCLATIRWYDNVPLLSWVLLRARCRQCKQSISWRYPAVELAVGVWFAICTLRPVLFVIGEPRRYHAYQHQTVSEISFAAFALAILGLFLLGLIVMDWQTHTLPDAFTLTGTAIGFVLICIQAVFLAPHEDELLLNGPNPLTSPGNVVDKGNVVLTGPEHLVLGRLLAIAAAAGIILLIRWAYKAIRHREGLGLGDAKLMAMIAAFLGFWPAVLAVFLGVVLCSGYALGLIVRGKATVATRLPLGSFLAVGGLISALIGAPLIAWYSSLL